MTKYESLVDLANTLGLKVTENVNMFAEGRIKSNHIYLSKKLDTNSEKVCILLEEIYHALLNTGDIREQSILSNRKQEYRARKNCYEELTPLLSIVEAVIDLQENSYPYYVAKKLDVTEKFLNEAIEYYKRRHGPLLNIGIYRIEFYPSFRITEKYK